MRDKTVEIEWPNGNRTIVKDGEDWLNAARKANIKIPTGCLGGSCGACEIEVNGEVYRACISQVHYSSSKLNVEFYSDPYW